MSEQELELQIKSKAEEATLSINKLVNSLTNLEAKVSNIDNVLKGQTIKTTNKDISSLKSSIDKATTSGNKLRKTLSFGSAYATTKRIGKSIYEWLDLAVDKTEQLNLFNVVFKNIEKDGVKTFSTLGQEAFRFQNKMNEAFGTNMTETLKFQGLYQSMGENVGIPAKYAAIMSESMTKFTYDLASLYNKSESTTGEALRAGVYAGQTKPLRSYGIDVTQQSMQPILDELGIDRSVKELSQAEKEILRYIATLRQGKVAMGDFANTIESPANQLKIFKQQLVETKVAVSSLFVGAFSQILPYANALLMVVKEVSRAIADMFGIELTDYNSGIASQEDAFEDLYDGVGSGADKAKKKVKELKREIFDFDEIHNINENKDTGGSGSSGSLAGGIDQRLLDAIKGYDNGMDKVRMKATEIRDKIMEWLGFTKEIDPLTGEVHWKLKDANSTMGQIITSFGEIITNGKKAIEGVFKVLFDDFNNGIWGKAIVATLNLIGDALGFIAENESAQKIIARIAETLLLIKGLKLIPGMSTIVDLIGKAISPTGGWAGQLELLGTSMKNAKQEHGSLIDGIGKGAKSWYDQLSVVDSLKIGIVGLVGGYGLLKVGLDELNGSAEITTGQFLAVESGIVSMSLSLGMMSDKLVNSNESLKNLHILGSSLGELAGPIGMLAGSISGLVVGIKDGLDSQKKAYEYTAKAGDKYAESLQQIKKSAQDSAETGLVQVERAQELSKELEKLVDANGEVKEGEEDRVKMILGQMNKALGTEYQLTDRQITLNGKAVKGYEEVEKSVEKLVEQKKMELLLRAYEDEYVEALKKKKEITDELTKKQERYNHMLELWQQDEEEAARTYGVSRKEMSESLDRQKKGIEELKKQVTDYQTEINNYDDLLTASVSEDSNKRIEAMKNFGIVVDETFENADDKAQQFYGNNNNQTLSCKVEVNTEMAQEKTNDYYKTNDGRQMKWNINTNTSSDATRINQYYSGWNNKVINFKSSVNTTSANTSLDTFFKKWSGKSFEWAANVVGKSTSSSKKASGGAFYNNSWHDIKQYANGGAPSHGSLFWAGENGAEVVAHANGRTEVLNQSQIASAIYNATLNAMSQVMSQYGNQTAEFRVYAEEGLIVEKCAKGFDRQVRQTGTLPFQLPAN